MTGTSAQAPADRPAATAPATWATAIAAPAAAGPARTTCRDDLSWASGWWLGPAVIGGAAVWGMAISAVLTWP